MLNQNQKLGQAEEQNQNHIQAQSYQQKLISVGENQFKLCFQKGVLFFNCAQERDIQAKNKIIAVYQKTQRLMNGNSLSICTDAFEQYHQLLFSCMLQNQFGSLNLSRNTQPNILKYIQFPIFKELVYLNLNGNNLNNVQPLAWISMPALIKILIQENNICQVKPFKKWANKQLVAAHIYHNPIKQIQPIFFLFNQQVIKDLTLQYKQDCPFPAIGQDLSKFMKMKGRICEELEIRQARRIPQSKIHSMIQNKFEKVRVLTQLTEDQNWQ